MAEAHIYVSLLNNLIYYTTLAVQIALWQSVISFTKITYHTAKIFRDFPCFYFMSFSWFYAHFG